MSLATHVRRTLRAYADRPLPVARQRHLLGQGPQVWKILVGMLYNHRREPGLTAQHVVSTLRASGDVRVLPSLVQHVDVEDFDLAYCVDAAVLSFGSEAVAPLLDATLRDPPRYGELLAELVANLVEQVGTDAVVEAFDRFFEDHPRVAVEGALLLGDPRLIPAAMRAVTAFDESSADRALLASLIELVESFGVSAGPVARAKAQRLGLPLGA